MSHRLWAVSRKETESALFITLHFFLDSWCIWVVHWSISQLLCQLFSHCIQLFLVATFDCFHFIFDFFFLVATFSQLTNQIVSLVLCTSQSTQCRFWFRARKQILGKIKMEDPHQWNHPRVSKWPLVRGRGDLAALSDHEDYQEKWTRNSMSMITSQFII